MSTETYEYEGITYLDGDAEQAALANHTPLTTREVRDDFRLTVATTSDGQAIVIDAALWDEDAVAEREIVHEGTSMDDGEPYTWTDTIREPTPGPAPEGINPTVRQFPSVEDAQAWADHEYANRLTGPISDERPDITIGWDETHRAGLVWDGSRRTADLWSSHGQDIERARAAAAQDGDRYRLAAIDGEQLRFADFDNREAATLALAEAAETIANGLEASGDVLDLIGAERMRELAAEQRQGVHRRRLTAALWWAKKERVVDRYGQIDNAELARRLGMSPQAVTKMLQAHGLSRATKALDALGADFTKAAGSAARVAEALKSPGFTPPKEDS